MDHIEEKFEVKYASSKKGPIKVSTFKTLDDAKKFLAQVKGEGMNGIISKGGKPVKEEEDLEKIVKELEKASQTHLGQSKRIKKHLDKMKKEEVELDEAAGKTPTSAEIKTAGKKLKDYAMKSGGIDKNDFLSLADTMMRGKMPNADSINNMDTDPREFVFDLMAKEFGYK